jgi:CII-binding regulator of phage lambda lysogenization HflD
MGPEFVNLYIERLLKDVTEGVKSRILLETQLKYTELINSQLQTKINELESQVEKLNKKKSKEVNTSDTF